MSTLDRLGLHQIFVLDIGAEPYRPTVDITNAAEHVARLLTPDDAELLRRGLALDRAGDWQLDVHYSLVRKSQFYQVVGQHPMQVALLPYQYGESVLIHLIWYWPAAGEPDTFAQLWACHWPGPPIETPGNLGQGILMTAGLSDTQITRSGNIPESQVEQLARACFEAREHGPTRLTTLKLPSADLYTSLHTPLDMRDWTALLLFANANIENSPAANRWVLDKWPLIVNYTLLLERLYVDRYRSRVQAELETSLRQIQHALRTTFAPSSGNVGVAAGTAHRGLPTNGEDTAPTDLPVPPVLATAEPRFVEEALRRLSGPQYRLLSALGEGERLGLMAHLHLRNLKDILRSLPILDNGSSQAAPDVDAMVVASRAQRWSDRIELGLAEARLAAERAARAVDVLSTHAETIRATYERVLTVRLAVVGFALAAAALFDQGAAKVLYGWWQGLFGIAGGLQPTDTDIFLIRFGAVALVALVTWLAPRLYAEIRHPGVDGK